MKESVIFGGDTVYLVLDKPYRIKFTFEAVRILEQRFGSIKAAFNNLYGETVEVSVNAAGEFINALTGIEKARVDKILKADNFYKVLRSIAQAFERDFKSYGKKFEYESEDDSYDWDNLYYIGRYRLKMSDDEFNECTPSKFNRLTYFWRIENGLEKPEQDIYLGDVEY